MVKKTCLFPPHPINRTITLQDASGTCKLRMPEASRFRYSACMNHLEWDPAVEAMASLEGPGHKISEASVHVPSAPGLYAVHAQPETWRMLGLEAPGGGIPLYVGKSEDDLVTRDLKTHFAIERGVRSTTGSSTVRRSFAALLREPLQLKGVPRNKLKPNHFSNYALEADADDRLSDWMHKHLTLAVWPKPAGLELTLAEVEKRVLRRWGPALNLTHVPTPLQQLRAARAIMAAEARAWA